MMDPPMIEKRIIIVYSLDKLAYVGSEVVSTLDRGFDERQTLL
jgi:hypothetical protein